MYVLITVVAALLVGLVLVALVETTFGRPEPVEDPHVETSDGIPGASDRPRFRVARRGYDIAEVDHYLDTLHRRSPAGPNQHRSTTE